MRATLATIAIILATAITLDIMAQGDRQKQESHDRRAAVLAAVEALPPAERPASLNAAVRNIGGMASSSAAPRWRKQDPDWGAAMDGLIEAGNATRAAAEPEPEPAPEPEPQPEPEPCAPVPQPRITRAEWAQHLVCGLAHVTRQDPTVALSRLHWIAAWMHREGTRATWNPLATTWILPSSTRHNSAGVQRYPTMASGLEATIKTLTAGDSDTYLYRPIVALLFDPRASYDGWRRAVSASDWSGTNYILPGPHELHTHADDWSKVLLP